MTALKYGQTWWGNEWLKALSHIDYSNRLPRGRSYASKGAVKELTIQENEVRAGVQGTQRTPYRVTVKIPAFSVEEKEALTSMIMEDPLLLSRLLNRELPSRIHRLAEERQIRIFPRRWDDLEMKCSCPDMAVPCKHLAAVINIMANEIDRNPFIIFRLHGYDVIGELKKQGMEAVKEEVAIPGYDALQAAETAPEYSRASSPGKPARVLLEQADFSGITDQRDNLLSLVPEKPLFHTGDFKAILEKIYKRTSAYVTREALNVTGRQDLPGVNYEKYTDVKFGIRNICFFSSCRLVSEDGPLTLNDPEALTGFLSQIPARQAGRLSSGLLLLWYLYRFVIKLAEESAYVPQLLRLGDSAYVIRWIPALINENVREAFRTLVRATPPGLVAIEDEDGQPGPAEQLKSLVSIMIRQFFRESSFDRSLLNDPVPGMFLEDMFYRFEGLGETEIPATIQRWTERFFLTHMQNIPLLKVSEGKAENQFVLEVLVEDSREPMKEPIPLAEVMTGKEFSHIRYDVLRILEMLTTRFPVLEHIISTSGRYTPEFTPNEFAGFMFDIMPVIRLHGIRILLPRELKHLVKPGLTLSLSARGSAPLKSFLDLDKILDFRWKVALGDEILDAEEFSLLVKGLSGIVRLRQQYVYLNPSDLKTLMEQVSRQERMNRNQLLQVAVTGEYNGEKIRVDRRTRELINALLEAGPVDLPEGLNATLRPYQRRGYDWLWKNAGLGFGSIIADDMGLGKTLQVITVLLKIKQEETRGSSQAIIVVPTTLLSNWQKEFEKFAPGITCSVYHGPGRALNEGTDIVLTSYGVVRSDRELLSGRKWKAVVIDEAQNIKNPGAGQSQAVKSLKGDIRIAMSGTPVENRLSEYWSVFDFTNKGYLGSLKSFTEKYAVPIEVERDKKALSGFLQITRPFILRRLKSDKKIISDLPDKIVNNYYATLVKDQAALYQNVLDTIMERIEQVDTDEKDGKIQRRGLVLKLILALKQVCNHPAQYLKKEECPPGLSGKSGLFMNLLENILENDEKTLVFTQFREMGRLLERMVKKETDLNCLFLHGGTSRKERDEMVEQFQQNPQRKIMILTTKAGGTGLNLTAASHVIHYDLWWNPAVEAQATDRAYRIGQDRNVMVYRLITKGTFEEKINAMLGEKQELADLAVATGEKWVSELSNIELKKLFTMGS